MTFGSGIRTAIISDCSVASRMIAAFKDRLCCRLRIATVLALGWRLTRVVLLVA